MSAFFAVRSENASRSITPAVAGFGSDVVCTSPFVVQDRNGIRREVPCGRCLSCRIRRSSEWATRIVHEASSHSSAIFTTLTYDDAHYPSNGSLQKNDLVRFWKRMRKRCGRIRYYAGGEYGECGGRPHYHLIVFGLRPCTCFESSKGVLLCRCHDRVVMHEVWGKGAVDRFGTVTYDSARYTADYIGKAIVADPEVWTSKGLAAPFQVMSQGLGRDFVDMNAEQLRLRKGVTIHGVPVGLPRYYATRLGIKLDPIERQVIEEATPESRKRHMWIGVQKEDTFAWKAPRRQRELDALAKARTHRKVKF